MSPIVKIRTLEEARKFSTSNLLDHEFGVKYEKSDWKESNFKWIISDLPKY
jgi:hypothetical protein